MVQDSGGAGEYRGGLAFVREFKLLADEAVFTTRADRRDHPPYGFAGARWGGGSQNMLITAEGKRALPTMPMEAVKWYNGDVFRHVSAGGGGCGDPFTRDPALVLADVLDDKVSVEAARDLYGVVIKNRAIDEKATQRLRSLAKAA
jgi:N-methylhydantoinase B